MTQINLSPVTARTRAHPLAIPALLGIAQKWRLPLEGKTIVDVSPKLV
jgi:hypothetical protein